MVMVVTTGKVDRLIERKTDRHCDDNDGEDREDRETDRHIYRKKKRKTDRQTW